MNADKTDVSLHVDVGYELYAVTTGYQ